MARGHRHGETLRYAHLVEQFGFRVEQGGDGVDVALVEVQGQWHASSVSVEKGAHFLVRCPGGCSRRLHVGIGIRARLEEHLRDFEETPMCRCPQRVTLGAVGTFVEIGIRPGVEQALDDACVVALGGG